MQIDAGRTMRRREYWRCWRRLYCAERCLDMNSGHKQSYRLRYSRSKSTCANSLRSIIELTSATRTRNISADHSARCPVSQGSLSHRNSQQNRMMASQRDDADPIAYSELFGKRKL